MLQMLRFLVRLLAYENEVEYLRSANPANDARSVFHGDLIIIVRVSEMFKDDRL